MSEYGGSHVIDTDYISCWLKQPFDVDEDPARDLTTHFEIALCEALLRGDPDNIPALAAVGHIYTRCGEHEKALAIDRRLAELLPTDPIVHYNLACSLSNLQEVDEALVELQRSIDLGYTDHQFMAKDPDLENARSHPRFRSLLDRARRKSRE